MGDWLQDRCNSIQKAQQEHIQKSFEPDVVKALSHKYIRKEGNKYIYEEPKSNKHGKFEPSGDHGMVNSFIASRFKETGTNSKDFNVSGNGEVFALQNKKTGDILHFKHQSTDLKRIENWLNKQKESK